MNTSLGKTEAQMQSAFEEMVYRAYCTYGDVFMAAGNVHTGEVRAAQRYWNALNRINVELFWLRSGGRDKVTMVETKVFVAEDWLHDCVRATKKDGIPLFDGKGWFCSRCKSGYYVNIEGCSREAAEKMFWSYLANNSFKRRQ